MKAIIALLVLSCIGLPVATGMSTTTTSIHQINQSNQTAVPTPVTPTQTPQAPPTTTTISTTTPTPTPQATATASTPTSTATASSTSTPTSTATASSTSTSTPSGSPPEPTESAPRGAPADLELVIDENVAIADYSVDDTLYTIRFYSDAYSTVTVTGVPTAGGGKTGTFEWQTVQIDSNAITVVDIRSAGPVSISTQKSRQDGVGYFLRKDTSILQGPYSQNDVTLAGIGGALGVSLAVLYEAITAKLAIRQSVEKLA